jgi:hypothetical protein
MMIERDSSNALTVDGSSLGVGVITSNPTSRSFGPSTADSQLRRGTPEDLNRLQLFDSIRGLPAGVFGQQGRRNGYLSIPKSGRRIR